MPRIVKYSSELKRWLQQYESIRLTAGENVAGQPMFHEAFGEQGSNAGAGGLNSTTEAGAPTDEVNVQVAVPKFEDDAAFADFVNLDFAMDDYGLFDLFYEPDLNTTTFDT